MTAATPKTDFEQVKEDLKTIREDVAALTATTGRLAAGHLKEQSKRVSALAETASEKAATYRDLMSDKVKDHPFASIAAAALAGLIVSSLRRR